ncbi:ATP-binding cassette, sub-B (MDR TAP), member 4 [Podila verticillata]|nr:ATP-binding cassette, sub-B (MDR TAP), member 4 [Podila verticillata]
MLILFCTYALAFWFGSREVHASRMQPGTVIAVFMGMMIGAFALGNIGPNVSSFASSQGAAYMIFKTIDRVPTIDSGNPNGARPENVQGHIVVTDVDFAYPSRPDLPILKKMSVEIKPGQTVALVDHSGTGSVTLDGMEIKDWNVTYLRDNIGIVPQEPVLFNATFKQNIAYSIRKGQSQPMDEEIEDACRFSNAHDFISKTPRKGALLPGGQKQRIAIARALIKNPKILLLDEATSVLDTESERIFQAALGKAATGRSTIVIAHCLLTIMNADLIYVMDKGIVVESGTHKTLMTLGGTYANFVHRQHLKTGGADVDNEIDEIVEAPAAALRIAVAEEALPQHGTADHRKSFALSTKLRRLSSNQLTRSEKCLQVANSTVAIPETLEDMEARKKKKAAYIKARKAPILRVLKSMCPEWTLIAIGAILSGGAGVIFSLFAKFFGGILAVLSTYDMDLDFLKKTNHDLLMFVLIGIGSFVTTGDSVLIFEYVGETLARRMRTRNFQAIMSYEMGFFDKEEHSTGALSSRLAIDAYQMHELISQILRLSFHTIATVILGLTYAFMQSWRLTLVILAIIPLMGASQYFAIGTLQGFSTKTKKAYENSGRIANEAIMNIRTVVLSGHIPLIYMRFAQELPAALATKTSRPVHVIIVNWTLTTLDLKSNSIGDDGAQALAEALKTNNTLTALYLGDNSIGDDGAQVLAEALKTNLTLTTLYLEDNSIGDNGAQALAEVLQTNLTCKIHR